MELNSCQGTPLPVSSTAAIWKVDGEPCLGLGYCAWGARIGGAEGFWVLGRAGCGRRAHYRQALNSCQQLVATAQIKQNAPRLTMRWCM